MNPFDLRGPEFLLFYSALGIVVVAAAWFWRRPRMPVGVHRTDLTDPYLIACLRGGPDEAIRVATCSLIERGLLRADQTRLGATRPDGPKLALKPLERALLKEFAKPRESAEMFRAPPIVDAVRELKKTLIDWGLMAARGRRIAAVAGMVLLFGVALTKIVVAFGRGRTNVLFLVLLAGLFVVLLHGIAGLRQTFRGLRALADLRTLFRGSRARGFSGGRGAADLALLTGVFGLGAAWSHTRSGEFRKLFPKSANEKGAYTPYGTTCGSSTSVTCGGGSSCGGGGGCGGGCGGCGGS